MGKDAFYKRKELLRGKLNKTPEEANNQVYDNYAVWCCTDRKHGL